MCPVLAANSLCRTLLNMFRRHTSLPCTDQGNMDSQASTQCALRIADVLTKTGGFDAESVSKAIVMAQDKLKSDAVCPESLDVRDRLLGQLLQYSTTPFPKDSSTCADASRALLCTDCGVTRSHIQAPTCAAGTARARALSKLRPYRKTFQAIYKKKLCMSKPKGIKQQNHSRPFKRGMGCKLMMSNLQHVTCAVQMPHQSERHPSDMKLCGDLADRIVVLTASDSVKLNCITRQLGTQSTLDHVRQASDQNRTAQVPVNLKDLLQHKINQAGPLILRARHAMLQRRSAAAASHRSSHSLVDRHTNRQLHLKMKRTRQRLHRLQNKQLAAGIVAYRQQLTLQGQATSCKLQRNTAIQQWHQTTKEEVRLAREAAAKERLAMLKSNDVDLYLKLVQSAKNSRLNQLLSQTDACLNNLAARLNLKSKLKKDAGASTETNLLTDSTEVGWNQLAASFQADIPEQPCLLTGGELREYQMQGLRWLAALHQNGLNGILADDMGLGKTVQVISLIAHLTEAHRAELPFMIVVPSSLVSNWEQEFQHWAPTLKLVAYKGTADARAGILTRQVTSGKAKFDVLLTSYDFLMGKNDRPRLSKLKWEYIIVDEGHRLKNAGCKLNAEIKMYSTKNRLLLTGTPVQNKLEELWALLNFLMPSLFQSSDEFQNWFAAPVKSSCMMDDEENAEAALLGEEESLLVTNRLHQVLRPFMLRRLKYSVATELPPKVEKLVPCQLSAYQKALCQLAKGELQTEEACKEPQALKRMNNTVVELRTICNHPLISRLHQDGSEALVTCGSQVPCEISLSGKLEVLDRMLVKLIAAGHKVLLFSTMTRALDVLEDYLDWRGYEHLRLDGAVRSGERGGLVRRFNDPGSNINVFLLSIRAGGVGLNLQAADTVIMYDTDWNPQIDLQAQARAHRIGQKREVLVLRLQTKGTVEERILQASSQKRSLADRSITGGFFDGNTGAEARRQYLLDLLKQTTDEQSGSASNNALMDHEVNVLIARGDSELQLFTRMDEDSSQSVAVSAQGAGRLASHEQVSGLIAEAKAAAVIKQPDEGKEFGRGKRCRSNLHREE